VEPGPGIFDRDLDREPARPESPTHDSIESYQRLVVNPFLAVLLFVIILMIEDVAIRTHNLGLFFLGCGLLVVPVLLVQYHCLDCGATRWLIRSRRHACRAVIVRMHHRERRRIPWPAVRVQLVGWVILLCSAFVLGLVMLASR
jgi:hypothetical protein